MSCRVFPTKGAVLDDGLADVAALQHEELERLVGRAVLDPHVGASLHLDALPVADCLAVEGGAAAGVEVDAAMQVGAAAGGGQRPHRAAAGELRGEHHHRRRRLGRVAVLRRRGRRSIPSKAPTYSAPRRLATVRFGIVSAQNILKVGGAIFERFGRLSQIWKGRRRWWTTRSAAGTSRRARCPRPPSSTARRRRRSGFLPTRFSPCGPRSPDAHCARLKAAVRGLVPWRRFAVVH